MTSVANLLILLGALLRSGALQPGPPQTSTTAQNPPPSTKASRTPAQQKIDSRLLDEIDRREGRPTRNTRPPDPALLKIDQEGRALVDVRAEVTPALLKTLAALKGTIVSTSQEYRSIIAWLPLLKLEEIAKNQVVHSIMPAPQPNR
jgi:hypothetical protein